MKKSVVFRGSVAAFGAAVLMAAGSAAVADDTELGNQAVDVNVEIEELAAPGSLAMTVEAAETTLVETETSGLEREFTGTLPKVTVTDTRDAESVDPLAAWYVLGSASDFVDADSNNTIPAANLGWAPQFVEGEGEGEDFVFVGGDVAPTAPGLIHQELLYSVASGEGNAAGGVFSATADLNLVVPADVAAGSYSSTITLSLFE
ncbi:hypothetical protein [Microbacterium album]|uniref:WxL domain-containing protein n=1 Tax=Microbacterium album TaxID=2053191 RepID=A0A917MQN8_9MICO|nr:hypothetical protein [Microbacterium album]GGH51746.1 hypothetical protein GCM10010921_31290 [Microbacterium album]